MAPSWGGFTKSSTTIDDSTECEEADHALHGHGPQLGGLHKKQQQHDD